MIDPYPDEMRHSYEAAHVNRTLQREGFKVCRACEEIEVTGDPRPELEHRHDRRRLTPSAVFTIGIFALITLVGLAMLAYTLITFPRSWWELAVLALLMSAVGAYSTKTSYDDWKNGTL